MPGINYSDAGVDVDAGERAVELMRASVARTMRREVVGGLGGFAGLFDISRYTGMPMDYDSMVETAKLECRNFLQPEVGDKMVVLSGVPFGQVGSTNNIRVATVR